MKTPRYFIATTLGHVSHVSKLWLGATFAMFLGSSSPTLAVQVQSVGGGITNVVFLDTYEDAPVIDGEPIAPQVGSWAFTSFYSHVLTNVPPGAAHGTKYLQMSRPPGGGTTIVADHGALSSAIYNNVLASFYFYVPVGTNAAVFEVSLTPTFDTSFGGLFSAPLWLEGLDGTSTTGELWTYVNGNGTGAGYTNTGLTFQKGVWNLMTIDYAFLAGADNDTFTFAVNGISSAPLNAGGYSGVADPTDLRYLDFRTGAIGNFFLDIPEPSTAVLVGLAGLALWRRKRTAK